MLLAVALAAIVPPIGAAVLRRTYRTDRALQSLAVPKPLPSAYLGASATAVAMILAGPLAGWSNLAALVVGPLFGMAFLTDAAGRVLPDLLTGALALVGLILAYFGLGLPFGTAAAGMAGMAIGLWCARALFIRAYGPGAFGLGDVKFVAASAAVVPISAITSAFVLAAPLALGLIFWRRFFPAADESFPFGSIYGAGLALLTIAQATMPQIFNL